MSSHSLLDNPKVFLSARLRLLRPAFCSGLSAFTSSTEPSRLACYSKIFRLSAQSFLSNGSSRTKSQTAIFCFPCGLLSDVSFHLCEHIFQLCQIFRNRNLFQSNFSLNQLSNEPLTAFFRLMNVESKLSVQTSALSERESEDSVDQESGPVKNLLPFPFVLSSLLSLV